jgi:two-component system response regulator FixJ
MMASNRVVHVIDDDEAARQSLVFLLGSAQFATRAYDSARALLDAINCYRTRVHHHRREDA